MRLEIESKHYPMERQQQRLARRYLRHEARLCNIPYQQLLSSESGLLLGFFGPVSMLFRANDKDKAIFIANDSPFGLGGSVFIVNTEQGIEVARELLHEWFLSIIQLLQRPIWLQSRTYRLRY